MSREPEAILEDRLIKQLVSQNYDAVTITNEADLLANFKTQIGKFNRIALTDKEFERVLNYLNGGTIFSKAKKMRDQFVLELENGDSQYIKFLDKTAQNSNIFQVTHQITMIGKRENRYDVTILINGLPLVQIELKRRGLELKEGFNQICRYHRESYKGLFKYIQIFVISNGVNSRYFSNNRELSFAQTFFWTDERNNLYSQLNSFAKQFLNRDHLAKLISNFIVMNVADKKLMILRPYQYYAVEKLVERTQNFSNQNGYIWHTTGSGKTLTSFKASQILTQNPEIDKVLFVVDRKDLDDQTQKEFNAFSKGSVDGTENTKKLIAQISDSKTKLIITTIQKLNNAIGKNGYKKGMEPAKTKRIVFIFDECHRSQFGDTHKKIMDFFSHKMCFGFTGTPIFAKNKIKNRTTKDLFDECLHSYVIKDAIDDQNVLGFSVEYYSTFTSSLLKDKEGNDLDIDKAMKVEGIDTSEVFNSERRQEIIVDHILANHSQKTHQKQFNAIFATGSISNLMQYYEIFKTKQKESTEKLNIAAIFSYQPNQDLTNDEGTFETEVENETSQTQARDRLDEMINEYNQTFGTNHDLNRDNGFNSYNKDISKKVKERKIDILLVVNMFLTGFDSKYLNTLYVDKNLKYHGLIQAFSRTNRIYGDPKNFGKILCYRNLKKRTDDAVKLFSNANALETVLMKPYDTYVTEFNQKALELLTLTPSVNAVDALEGEKQKAKFITTFRNLLRLMNLLTTFNEFSFADLSLSEQQFADFRSKYLDLYAMVKNSGVEKVSILNDLDFAIELIRRDKINVNYIMQLLLDLDSSDPGYAGDVEFILKTMDGNDQLRDKRELIEKFINENLPELQDRNKLEDEFENFINQQREAELQKFIITQNLDAKVITEVIEDYEFSAKLNRDSLKLAILDKLKLTDRIKKISLVQTRIMEIVEMFRF